MGMVEVILKNTLVLFAAQIISLAMVLIFTIYMARYLGVVSFGLLSFALAISSAFAIFGDFGLSTLTTREVARNKPMAGKYLGNVIILKLFMVLITLGLVVITVNLSGYPDQTAKVIYLIALSIIFTTFTQTFNSIFQAFEKMEYQSIGSVLSSVLMLAGALLVVWLGMGIVEFALTYFAANAIVMAYSLLVCSWKITLPRLDVDIKFWKSMLTAAFPFGLSLMASMLHSNMDSILLSAMKGYEAVGLYNAAFRLVAVLVIIPGMINVAIFPAMSRLHFSSKASLGQVAEKYFKIMLAISLPISVGTIFLSDKIVRLIFGESYVESAFVLRILVLATVFTYMGAAYIRLCESSDRQMLIAKLSVAGLAVNLGLNLLLIPTYSYIGSSIARFVSEAFLVTIVLYAVYKIGYGPSSRALLNSVLKVSLACLAMGTFLAFFSGLSLVISVIMASALYIFILFIIGGIDREYIDLFKSIVFRRGVMGK